MGNIPVTVAEYRLIFQNFAVVKPEGISIVLPVRNVIDVGLLKRVLLRFFRLIHLVRRIREILLIYLKIRQQYMMLFSLILKRRIRTLGRNRQLSVYSVRNVVTSLLKVLLISAQNVGNTSVMNA
ncbi:hypothetical protein J6C36_04785 [Methanocorpusculaceae archaeon]|nr:hypothetical protein [Methanocorpusculaceae archaeon]